MIFLQQAESQAARRGRSLPGLLFLPACRWGPGVPPPNSAKPSHFMLSDIARRLSETRISATAAARHAHKRLDKAGPCPDHDLEEEKARPAGLAGLVRQKCHSCIWAALQERGSMSAANHKTPDQRLAETKDAMHAACHAAGRPATAVQLVAVSKQQPEARITAMLEAGQRLYGENRVQEAYQRWAGRRADWPELRLHLIGPLQSNKVAEAVALFDVIETVDRPKIAAALAAEMSRQNRPLLCLIQVNTGEEPQKSGILPEDLASFYDYCTKEAGLQITGLMCIPPAEEEPAMHFALLARLAADLGLDQLSMGMSGDYAEAIRFGATSVRVGSALFGPRAPRP